MCCAVLWYVMLQDESLKLPLDVARGLAYMHEVDVVHGDVNSWNLLVFQEAETQCLSCCAVLWCAAGRQCEAAA
jgi:tRNA A-37 threonylcarbamoyl transferase component Bud32